MNRRFFIRMKQSNFITLILLVLLVGVAIWVALPNNTTQLMGRNLEYVLGLDLRGGVQALLEVPSSYQGEVTTAMMENAKNILENRTNALGVTENVFQVAGDRRIVAEFPGLTDPAEVLAVIKETGQLEFVDLGDTNLAPGTKITTDLGAATQADPTIPYDPANPTAKVWHTVMTGDQLDSVGVTPDSIGNSMITFRLKTEGTRIFRDFTAANIGKTLAIVLDKTILSAPNIEQAITEGQGQITGRFTVEEANNLAIQMNYGALPIPFEVVESRVIGPTLGEDSLNKSLIAGLVGFTIVILFMSIYYRLPGFVAVVSILIYAVLTLAIFKLIGVTLTLPGIAGFLLSTGSALDANILIFERLKEELRAGRTLMQSVELAWKRAWPSIRDSNIATIITSLILLWFGSQFGATIVKGFAVTLLLDVVVSLFCAFIVTRTFLNLVMAQISPDKRNLKWFGIYE
jgi:preprotein translocase subunit SecD